MNPEIKVTYTSRRLGFTARILPVTSHDPEVRNMGVLDVAGLNNAMWLKPSSVGTMSR